MSDHPKYSQAFVREITATVKARNGRSKKVHKAWKGVLKYSEPNPDFVEKPTDGSDTRTASQKRRVVWRQIAKTFDPETVRTKSEALQALQDWRADLEDKADESTREQVTVAEYLTSYIDTLETAGTVSASTISDYRTSSRSIIAGIGSVVFSELTPATIQAWETDLLKGGKGVNTVLKYHRLLNSVCNHALKTRELQWNPCIAVKKPKRLAPSPNSLTAEQYARLVATLAAMEPSQTVTAATIAAYTGMREGEICGLKWKCYDEDTGIIRIEQAIAKAGGKSYVSVPKTEASKRELPTHPALAAMLSRRKAAMVHELQEAGITLKPAEFAELYVCGTVDGRYMDATTLGKAWRTLSESFGLIGTQGRRITFHDLRHTFATRAIAAGADVKSVASFLGHTDSRVTLNVYADADRESKQNAIARVGDEIKAQGEVKLLPVFSDAGGVPESD